MFAVVRIRRVGHRDQKTVRAGILVHDLEQVDVLDLARLQAPVQRVAVMDRVQPDGPARRE